MFRDEPPPFSRLRGQSPRRGQTLVIIIFFFVVIIVLVVIIIEVFDASAEVADFLTQLADGVDEFLEDASLDLAAGVGTSIGSIGTGMFALAVRRPIVVSAANAQNHFFGFAADLIGHVSQPGRFQILSGRQEMVDAAFRFSLRTATRRRVVAAAQPF